MAEIVAETERLVLRRELPGDLEVWLEHMNTPEVAEMVGGVQPPEKVTEGFAKMAEAAAEGAPSFLLVALKSDGTLIGKCGLAPIETAVAPEELRNAIQVGWTLRADHWGQGYAREAAQAALALAFDHFGLTRLYAQTSQRNVASWRLMERLGMRRRSELDYPDADYPPEDNPTMVYSLDRADWTAAGAGERDSLVLETERLFLRNWRADDFGALHDLCTCPDVMATIGPLHDEQETRDFLVRLQERSARFGHTFWAMERKDDGRVIGFCGVSRGPVPPIEGLLEIGWRMAADCWGQSFAREAADATLGWIAENRPGEPVCAITSVDNTRSRGLMKRLGMRYRPDLDFIHPKVEDPRLQPHVTYWLDAAQ